MSKLAKQEACQLFIEQEIEEGLEKGKTPYSIGKEVAQWIEKLFQAKVKPTTIEKRAERIRYKTSGNAHDVTYFLSNGKYIKIGKTVDYKLQDRISTLQAGNPKKLYLECKIDIDCEKEFHEIFAACRNKKDREWFELPKTYLETVKSYCDTNNLTYTDSCSHIEHGGKRENAGRPPKFRPPKFIVKQEQFRTSFTSENEWYTPIQYIEATRQVMGEIDLDPATSEFGQSRIKAINCYTKEENGLNRPWIGRIWLNPPYSQPDIMLFADKLIAEIEMGNVIEAIVLTHNYTDTAWFHNLALISNRICFTRGRVKYEKQDGTIAAPTQGATFFYFGKNNKFEEIFEKYGFIVKRI